MNTQPHHLNPSNATMPNVNHWECRRYCLLECCSVNVIRLVKAITIVTYLFMHTWNASLADSESQTIVKKLGGIIEYSSSLPPKTISILFFGNTQLSDKDLEIVLQFPDLTSLSVNSDKITDQVILTIGKIPHLERLTLYAAKLTDGAFENCSNTNLQELYLGSELVSSKTCRAIARFKKLRKLGLISKKVDDNSVAQLADCQELRFLVLTGCGISDESATSFSKMSRLEGLGLQNVTITEKTLAQLNKLHHLQFLDLTETKLTSQCIPAIASHAGIIHLRLCGCELTEKDFMQLSESRSLKKLSVYREDLTLDAIERLRTTLKISITLEDSPKKAYERNLPQKTP